MTACQHGSVWSSKRAQPLGAPGIKGVCSLESGVEGRGGWHRSTCLAMLDVCWGWGGVEERSQEPRRTFSHSLWTSASASCLHCIRLSIQPSRVGTVAGSMLTGASSVGTRPTSSMFVSMLAIGPSAGSAGSGGEGSRGREGLWSGSNGRSAWSTAVAKNGSNDVCCPLARLCLQARRGAGPRLGQNWAGGQVGGCGCGCGCRW